MVVPWYGIEIHTALNWIHLAFSVLMYEVVPTSPHMAWIPFPTRWDTKCQERCLSCKLLNINRFSCPHCPYTCNWVADLQKHSKGQVRQILHESCSSCIKPAAIWLMGGEIPHNLPSHGFNSAKVTSVGGQAKADGWTVPDTYKNTIPTSSNLISDLQIWFFLSLGLMWRALWSIAS